MNPQSPWPLPPRLCRRERGTGKARRVEQQGPDWGRATTALDTTAAGRLHRKHPQPGSSGPSCAGGALGSGPGRHCPAPIAHQEGAGPGEAPLTPQGQRGRGRSHQPHALGWWLFPKSSGHASACLSQEVPERSTRIATLSTGTLLVACDCLPWGVCNLFPKPI